MQGGVGMKRVLHHGFRRAGNSKGGTLKVSKLVFLLIFIVPQAGLKPTENSSRDNSLESSAPEARSSSPEMFIFEKNICMLQIASKRRFGKIILLVVDTRLA